MKKYIKIGILVIVIVVIVVGIAAWLVSFFPFRIVRTKIDTFTSDGVANTFTKILFDRIMIRLRYWSIVTIFIGFLLYMKKKVIENYTWNLIVQFISLLKQSKILLYKEFANDKVYLYALLTILAEAIFVRSLFLQQPLRGDEAYTFIYFASKPLWFGLSSYTLPNNHLFHTLLVHISYIIFGNHLWAIRLPAFIFGILLVPASYILARIFYNKQTALLTAALVTSSSILIEYSTNARGYTILCFIFLLILIFANYLRRNNNPTLWSSFVILSTIGFCTIPSMVFPFGVVIVWLLLSIVFDDKTLISNQITKNLTKAIIAIFLLTLMLYSPVIVANGFGSLVNKKFLIAVSYPKFSVGLSSSIISTWLEWNRDFPTFIRYLLIIGFFVSLITYKKFRNHHVPIFLPAVIWCIPILVFLKMIPFKRTWLFLLPIYLSMSSMGVGVLLSKIMSKIKKPGRFIFIPLSLILSLWIISNVIRSNSILYSRETGVFREAEQIAIYFKGHLRIGDRVFAICPQDAILLYYFDLFGIPTKILNSGYNIAIRKMVVVNELNETLEEVITKLDSLDISKDAVEIIYRYEHVKVYEAGRRR